MVCHIDTNRKQIETNRKIMSRYYDNSKTYVEPCVSTTLDSTVILFSPSPIEPLMNEPLFNGSDSCIHLGCDISILFNQERISRELAPIVEEWFTSHSSDLSDRYNSLSDAEILSCIKSRYIQRPSEIQDWTAYLSSELDSLVEAKKDSLDRPLNPDLGEPQPIEPKPNSET